MVSSISNSSGVAPATRVSSGLARWASRRSWSSSAAEGANGSSSGSAASSSASGRTAEVRTSSSSKEATAEVGPSSSIGGSGGGCPSSEPRASGGPLKPRSEKSVSSTTRADIGVGLGTGVGTGVGARGGGGGWVRGADRRGEALGSGTRVMTVTASTAGATGRTVTEVGASATVGSTGRADTVVGASKAAGDSGAVVTTVASSKLGLAGPATGGRPAAGAARVTTEVGPSKVASLPVAGGDPGRGAVGAPGRGAVGETVRVTSSSPPSKAAAGAPNRLSSTCRASKVLSQASSSANRSSPKPGLSEPPVVIELLP
jgi:hypothetical protein